MTPEEVVHCPHRSACGGCALIGEPLEAQLAWKRERVRAALARYPALETVPVSPCAPAPAPVGYRTRLKLAVERRPDAPRAAIGLFRPGTHEVADAPGCRVAHPLLPPVVEALREVLAGAAGHGEAVPVEHVDLRASRAERAVHVTLVARPGADVDAARRLADELMAQRPEVVGVALRLSGDGVAAARVVGGVTRALAGRQELIETIGRARFRLSPGAFFQADPAAAEVLHEVVRGWLAGGGGRARHLVDLYAGVGAFAVSLAGLAERTTAVEAVEAAAADARASVELSCAGSGATVEVVTGDVERHVALLGQERPDRVVLDPPRRGATAAVLGALAAAAPERAAYVSCDPDTLARDLDALAPLGLEARAVVPVDLFSLTDQVEAVALLAPAARPWVPVVRLEGPGLLVAEKPAILPTHPQEPGRPSLLEALRRATGRDDLQPAHRLDVGTSGPVVFASSRAETGPGTKLAATGRAFATGAIAKEYLALVRGVPRRAGRVRSGDGEDTRYRLVEVVGGYGLVSVRPATGARHQIRRHLRRIGHPILGDQRYGDPRANRFLAESCGLARLFLHLAVLELPAALAGGAEGATMRIESPLPPELRLVLDRLQALRRP